MEVCGRLFAAGSYRCSSCCCCSLFLSVVSEYIFFLVACVGPSVGLSVPLHFLGVLRLVSEYNIHYCPHPTRLVLLCRLPCFLLAIILEGSPVEKEGIIFGIQSLSVTESDTIFPILFRSPRRRVPKPERVSHLRRDFCRRQHFQSCSSLS